MEEFSGITLTIFETLQGDKQDHLACQAERHIGITLHTYTSRIPTAIVLFPLTTLVESSNPLIGSNPVEIVLLVFLQVQTLVSPGDHDPDRAGC